MTVYVGRRGPFLIPAQQAMANALKADLLVGLSTYATYRSIEDRSLKRIESDWPRNGAYTK